MHDGAQRSNASGTPMALAPFPLPTDVLRHVIGRELARNSMHALVSASLACKQLRAAFRPLLATQESADARRRRQQQQRVQQELGAIGSTSLAVFFCQTLRYLVSAHLREAAERNERRQLLVWCELRTLLKRLHTARNDSSKPHERAAKSLISALLSGTENGAAKLRDMLASMPDAEARRRLLLEPIEKAISVSDVVCFMGEPAAMAALFEYLACEADSVTSAQVSPNVFSLCEAPTACRDMWLAHFLLLSLQRDEAVIAETLERQLVPLMLRVPASTLPLRQASGNRLSLAHYCASMGRPKLLKVLQEHFHLIDPPRSASTTTSAAAGASKAPSDSTQSLVPVLHVAAAGGHREMVEYLLETLRVPIDERSKPDGRSVLHVADSSLVRLLVRKYGADPRATAADQSTILFTQTDPEVLEFLVRECGVEVGARDRDGDTAAMCAARRLHVRSVDALMRLGCPVLMPEGKEQAIHIAARARDGTDMVRVLLDHGVDINIRDQTQCTPLERAAYYGRLRTAKLLLQRGADLRIGDSMKWTPLHSAAFRGEYKTCKLLLDAGASRTAQTLAGDTPERKAATSSAPSAKRVELLLKMYPKEPPPLPKPQSRQHASEEDDDDANESEKEHA